VAKKCKKHAVYILPNSGKEFFKVSIPMFWISAMVILHGCADTLLLGYFLTGREVGIYSIAIKVSCAMAVPMLAVNSVVASKYTELSLKGETIDLQKASKKCFKSSIADMCACLFGHCIFCRKDNVGFWSRVCGRKKRVTVAHHRTIYQYHVRVIRPYFTNDRPRETFQEHHYICHHIKHNPEHPFYSSMGDD
jgi:hypothetical protein